nr:transposase [Mycoplasmopsis bovis]
MCLAWEILVADKGFRTKAITELLEQNKKKYLWLKRNTTLIREKNLMKTWLCKIKDKQLLGSKKQIDGKFTFKDLEIAGKESVGNYQKHLKRNTFNMMNSIKIINLGMFESNVDLSLEDVYTLYDQRWEIEESLTLQKYFGTIKNKSSFRNESLHNRVYKLLSLIIATKVKNNLIRLNLHQNYSLTD